MFEDWLRVAPATVENATVRDPDAQMTQISGTEANWLLDDLTPKQVEVLDLLVQHRTTKQIARHLHISPKTVEGHRLRLMAKLKMDSVAQLTKYAIQEGLTSPEP